MKWLDFITKTPLATAKKKKEEAEMAKDNVCMFGIQMVIIC